MTGTPHHALWLLNHRTAIRSDAAMLRSCGYTGIYFPKSFPATARFRSAAVIPHLDKGLSLTEDEQRLLDSTDWYRPVGDEIWDLVNRRFSVLAFRPWDCELTRQILTKFDGQVILRGFGVGGGTAYTTVLQQLTRGRGLALVESLGDRFIFGQAYTSLADIEHEVLRSRSVHLPLSLPVSAGAAGGIVRDDHRVLFVCPDINANPLYLRKYEEFKRHLGGLDHVICGNQAVEVRDPAVIGFQPQDIYDELLRRCRVMFYDSRDPRHLHYHPIEAIRAGLPVVFLSGGLLQELGGRSVKGCVDTWQEGRHLLQRLASGDRRLVESVSRSQLRILEAFDEERCSAIWRDGLSSRLQRTKSDRPTVRDDGPVKVAVFLPERYFGGTLRATRAIAEAIVRGARAAGREARVVLAPLDLPGYYPTDVWQGLDPAVELRPAKWRPVDAATIEASVHLSRNSFPAGVGGIVPDDGHAHYQDCAVWVVVSDRVSAPIFRARPVVMVVFDTILRYVGTQTEPPEVAIARRLADRIAVTTSATRNDLVQHGSIPSHDIHVVPPLLPDSCVGAPRLMPSASRYFVWGTNLGLHKNHEIALRALEHYYGRLGGRLRCIVTGVRTESLREEGSEFSRMFRAAAERVPLLGRKLRIAGHLADDRFLRKLSGASFFWNPSVIDNGTFTSVEAAARGVPTVSSDYPAMRELAKMLGMCPIWTPSWDPVAMAEGLAKGEEHGRRDYQLLNAGCAAMLRGDEAALAYWRLVEDLA